MHACVRRASCVVRRASCVRVQLCIHTMIQTHLSNYIIFQNTTYYAGNNRMIILCRLGGSRLVGRGSQSGVVICRSTYEPGGGGDMCRSTYRIVNISRLLILQSLH